MRARCDNSPHSRGGSGHTVTAQRCAHCHSILAPRHLVGALGTRSPTARALCCSRLAPTPTVADACLVDTTTRGWGLVVQLSTRNSRVTYHESDVCWQGRQWTCPCPASARVCACPGQRGRPPAAWRHPAGGTHAAEQEGPPTAACTGLASGSMHQGAAAPGERCRSSPCPSPSARRLASEILIPVRPAMHYTVTCQGGEFGTKLVKVALTVAAVRGDTTGASGCLVLMKSRVMLRELRRFSSAVNVF